MFNILSTNDAGLKYLPLTRDMYTINHTPGRTCAHLTRKQQDKILARLSQTPRFEIQPVQLGIWELRMFYATPTGEKSTRITTCGTEWTQTDIGPSTQLKRQLEAAQELLRRNGVAA
jgi:hypothetical protein